jgi:hypothetical protein
MKRGRWWRDYVASSLTLYPLHPILLEDFIEPTCNAHGRYKK